MKKNNQLLLAFFEIKLISRIQKVCFLSFLLLLSNIVTAQTSDISWMQGSWGVTFPIFGGERLDKEVAEGYDLVGGAQEIVDELTTTDYVITNLSYFAHSHYFTMSANTNVDVAKEIHPALVPNAANDQIIFDSMKILKNSGKKIILYISTNYMDRLAGDNPAAAAAWTNYYTTKFGGDEYAAYKDLIRGFVENVKDYADGYWFDTATALIQDKNYDDFVDMFREVDPTALMAATNGDYLKIDGSEALVDSDGNNDENPRDYKIIIWETSYEKTDFTHGHITPLGQGAPPNSWGYEEFTIPAMIAEPVAENNGKKYVKHGWFPMRESWHSPASPIVFGTEDAYRFARRITDNGAAMTFATTTADNGNMGHMMADEMTIMKEINRRLLMNPKMDYVPYTRPAGAKLVGETAPNYHQIIDFQPLPVKDVNDADFTPFVYASSGASVTLTSSNTNVATIVNNKIRIKGAGTTTITAKQAGNNTFATAMSKAQLLTVTTDDGTDPNPVINGDNLALNGVASQSSTAFEGEASRAIDGNTNGAYSGGSVTHTTGGLAGEWWQVALNELTNINEIKIFNRTDDCCMDRLSNFTVLIYDANGTRVFNERVTSIPNSSVTVNADGVLGKIVRIRTNTTDALSLAEVAVYGEEVKTAINLALNGVASQSSTNFEGEASRAIDGNTNGAYSEGSVTHTNNDAAPYWQVELDSAYSIGDINIFGRTDDCCLERLSNFTVMVYNEGTRTFLKTLQSYPDPSITVNAEGAVGNLIRIRSNTGKALSLAEVQVFDVSTAAKTVIDISQSALQIYPNPVEDQFTINLDTSKTSNYIISDTTGKTILTGVINNGNATINVSSLSTGLYLIQVSNELEIIMGKMVKQ